MMPASDLLNTIDDLVITADAVMDSLQFNEMPHQADKDNLGDAISNARNTVQKWTNEQEPCNAIIYHGPGHQSRTRCYLTGTHNIHETRYGSFDRLARWVGDEVFSGFFDEAPCIEGE